MLASLPLSAASVVSLIGWACVVLLMAVGFVGCFVPLLPGTVLILAGVFSYQWWVAPAGHALGNGTLFGMTLLVVGSHLAEFAAGLLGASRYGASKHGLWGGLIGLVIGMFFSLPGLLLGPLLGVIAGELLSGKSTELALRAAWGSVVGNAAGIVLRVVTGAGIILWFVFALWRA